MRIKPHDAGDFISRASKLFPLQAKLSHLKRVRRDTGNDHLLVIVCAAAADEDADSQDAVSKATMLPEITHPTNASTPSNNECIDLGRIPQAVCILVPRVLFGGT